MTLALSSCCVHLPQEGQKEGRDNEGQENTSGENSLVVQRLGLRTFTAKGPGSIPGQGTKTPQATRCGQKTPPKKHFRSTACQHTNPTWKPPITNGRGFPGGAVVMNPLANAGVMGSSPGLGRSHMPWSNEAHAPQLLSLRSGAREPQLLKPVCHNYWSLRAWSLCSATREATAMRSPRQLERAHAQPRKTQRSQ